MKLKDLVPQLVEIDLDYWFFGETVLGLGYSKTEKSVVCEIELNFSELGMGFDKAGLISINEHLSFRHKTNSDGLLFNSGRKQYLVQKTTHNRPKPLFTRTDLLDTALLSSLVDIEECWSRIQEFKKLSSELDSTFQVHRRDNWLTIGTNTYGPGDLHRSASSSLAFKIIEIPGPDFDYEFNFELDRMNILKRYAKIGGTMRLALAKGLLVMIFGKTTFYLIGKS